VVTVVLVEIGWQVLLPISVNPVANTANSSRLAEECYGR
jgi:hypothetical protein